MNSVTLADLEKFAATPRSEAGGSRHPKPSADSDSLSNVSGDWSAIVAGCAFAQHCVAHSAALPEPYWFVMGSLLSRCDEGYRQFHELSQADERYDPAETDAKFEHARSGSPPRTCRSIRDDLGYEGCSRCPMWRHA